MPSTTSLAESAVQARIKDKLNMEGVKLWLEPFFDPVTSTPKDTEILALVSRYVTELELPEGDVAEGIYSLQRNAIERLAERENFASTGLATVRLRLSGFSSASSAAVATLNRLQVNITSTTGKQFKETIATLLGVPHVSGIKLIGGGRVLDEAQSLEAQGVRNGTQVMVLSVAMDHETIQEVEDQLRELEDTKNSADYLSAKDGTDGTYSLQVADQSGKPLDLPLAEKKALTIALALHEKGRSFMKLGQFSKSLVFLLEADTLYSQCNSQILEMVDNYGLLNLDVAWVYLSLQSIAELPRVEARLQACERALIRSYGEDMTRVVALKGSSGSGIEAALYVRLHLLQGITNYHLGHIEKSNFYLNKAEAEMGRLKVSDDSLAALINMGYGSEEARVALRSTYGDLPSAVDWIIRKREEKAVIKADEKEDLKKKKLQKKLGTTQNGDPVNVNLFKQLKDMGYAPFLITEALKRTNNDANSAVQMMSDSAFEAEALANTLHTISNQPSTSSESEALAAAVANVQELAASLPSGSSSNSSLTHAIQALSSNPDVYASAVSAVKQVLNQSFSEDALASAQASAEDLAKSQKAYDLLAKDIRNEADYIDLTLAQETEYLLQYKNYLAQL